MTRGNSRLIKIMLMHVLILGLAPFAKPSDQMTLDILEDAPNAEEIAFLEELTLWISEEEEANQPDEPIRDVIREHPSTFDFFRTYHDKEIRLTPLHELPFGKAIRQVAERHGVDGLLVASVVEAESRFQPEAVSHRGAVGLMQVMPATGEHFSPEQLQDPHLNLDLGTRYLRSLLDRYEGDLELALAAYNAGPTNVRRYGGVPPFRETRRYVEKVLDIYFSHHRSVWQESETGEFLISG